MLTVTHLTIEFLGDYAFYAGILVLVSVFISFKTGQTRLKNKAFANPEDTERHGGSEFYRLDDEVERLRRIHRNELENIPYFVVVSALYLLTEPTRFWYLMLLRMYTILRITYVIAYMQSWKAPWRSVIFSIGLYFIMVPMLLIIILSSLW